MGADAEGPEDLVGEIPVPSPQNGKPPFLATKESHVIYRFEKPAVGDKVCIDSRGKVRLEAEEDAADVLVL